MSTARQHGYGWKPGLPDQRDLILRYSSQQRREAANQPVDLRLSGFLPDIWDQGQLGSCVSHGVGRAYSYDVAKQGGEKNFNPSRLFLYYGGRVIEGTVNEDSGLTIADGVKSLNMYGAPPSVDWPYDISKFTQKPPSIAYTDGAARQAAKYARVPQTVQDMTATLVAGYPIVIGFTVYDSFESDQVASTGVVPMPAPGERVLGGHCVTVVGVGVDVAGQPVDDGRWLCANSWGTSWGAAGFFTFPKAYLTNTGLSDDFWVVQQVESPDPTPNPPTPGPQPDVIDAALIAGLDPWARKKGLTTCMRQKVTDHAVDAYELWKTNRGY